MEGWIKLHRSLLEWEWYDDVNTFRLFVHILLKANHKDRNYRGEKVKRGEFLTGRELLSKETGLSVRQIRTSLDKLKSTNELTIKSGSKGTVIQVVKYNEYQVTTSETTNERPTSDQRATTNKNNKKEEKVINKNIPTLEDFKKHGIKKLNELGKNPNDYIYSLVAKYESWIENDWRDGNDQEIIRWRSKLTNTIPHLSKNQVKAATNNHGMVF